MDRSGNSFRLIGRVREPGKGEVSLRRGCMDCVFSARISWAFSPARRRSSVQGMESMDFHTAKALLEWQVELGATEAIGDVPVNRYDVPRDR